MQQNPEILTFIFLLYFVPVTDLIQKENSVLKIVSKWLRIMRLDFLSQCKPQNKAISMKCLQILDSRQSNHFSREVSNSLSFPHRDTLLFELHGGIPKA